MPLSLLRFVVDFFYRSCSVSDDESKSLSDAKSTDIFSFDVVGFVLFCFAPIILLIDSDMQFQKVV
jgi:hypothetical protein